jgi:hypothetical protein
LRRPVPELAVFNHARIAAAVLTFALPLSAQENPPAEATDRVSKYGIGVSLSPVAVFIDDVGFIPFGFTNILIPIKIAPATYLEPEIGLFRTSSNAGGTPASFTNTRLGVGLLMGLRERGVLKPYVGPRIGMSRLTSKQDTPGGTFTTKQTTWILSGVVGAQHFFTPHFSLGGEAQLSRASSGDAESSPPGTGDPGTTSITTNGLVTLRWFF